MSHFTGLQAQEIQQYWDLLVPLLEKPLKKTGTIRYIHPEHALQKCMLREWQCWIAHNGERIQAAFITYITPHPTGWKTFTIDLAGGEDIDQWLPEVWDTFKEYARANGCDEVVLAGRKGWLRKLDDDLETDMRFRLELKK